MQGETHLGSPSIGLNNLCYPSQCKTEIIFTNWNDPNYRLPWQSRNASLMLQYFMPIHTPLYPSSYHCATKIAAEICTIMGWAVQGQRHKAYTLKFTVKTNLHFLIEIFLLLTDRNWRISDEAIQREVLKVTGKTDSRQLKAYLLTKL